MTRQSTFAVIGAIIGALIGVGTIFWLRQAFPAPTTSTPLTEVEFNTAVATYCDSLGVTEDGYPIFSRWQWEPWDDPNPRDNLAPLTCLDGSGEFEIWVDLETLEVTPRIP